MIKKENLVDKLTRLLSSRKFWAALVGLGMVVIKTYAPSFPISEEQMTALVVLLASYILGTAVEDAGLAKKPAASSEETVARRSSL